MITLNKDFAEFIESLNGREVNYLVIGGYAVNLHGYPRYTKDIDFWIEPREKNIQKLLSAIKDFGFGSLDLKMADFMSPDQIIQLGMEPRRIDLLTRVEGLNFKRAFKQKNQVKLDGININFLDVRDLITAKKTSARLQDLADAEQLEKIKNKQ
jgi:predicted nucleotidyltransferase